MQPSNLCLPRIGIGSVLLAMSITAFGLVGTAYAQAVLTAPGRYVIVVTQEVPNVLRAGEALQLQKCVELEKCARFSCAPRTVHCHFALNRCVAPQ